MKNLVIYLSCLLLWIECAAQFKFRAPTGVSLPPDPYHAVTGDFNGDGRDDIITANFTNNTNQQITLILNSGNGSLENKQNFPAAGHTLDIVTGDFNEDGKLDAVSLSQSGSFSLLLGNGNGGFAAPVNVTAGDTPSGIDAADFDGDGHLDLVVATRGTPSQLLIFEGDGTGNFTTGLVENISNLYTVVTADFNSDGNADLALNIGATAQIRLGDGSGATFALVHTITGVSSFENITAGNLDNDTDIDLIAGRYYALNNGNGVFGVPTGLSQSQSHHAIADVNGDTFPDLVITDHNQNTANVRILLGDGNGNFQLLAKFETDPFARALVAVDFNNDGHIDVFAGGSWGGTPYGNLLTGDGTGYFTNAIFKYPLANAYDIVDGDFDEDGFIDYAVTVQINYSGSQIHIFKGSSNGRLTKDPSPVSIPGIPNDLLVFDHNKDGHLDLVTYNLESATASISVLNGDGNGNFNVLPKINFGTTYGQLALGDFNGDGNVDILATNPETDLIFRFNGTGSGFNAPVSQAGPNEIYFMKAADFDGDTHLDLVVTFDGSGDRLGFMYGDGLGNFTLDPNNFPSSNTPPIITDINGDGKPDVINADSFDDDIFINAGSRSFTTTDALFNGGRIAGLADMDGDGINDLITSGQNPNSSSPGLIMIYKGITGGLSSTELISKNYSGGFRVVVRDVNADSKPDLVVTSNNIYEDYVGVLMNDSGPTTCTPPVVNTQANTYTICEGASLNLQVSVTGSNPLTYQWQLNGTVIAGARNPTYLVNALTTGVAGSYTVVVSNSCGSVTSNAIQVNVVSAADCDNAPPVFTGTSTSVTPNSLVRIDLSELISDANDDLDLASLKIIGFPASGAPAYLEGTTLIVDYSNVDFAGEDAVILEVCDLGGNCATSEIIVNVEGQIVVYTGVSPNGDAYNPIWILENIEEFPDTQNNQVTLYNRWGDKVFSVENYDNSERVFRGISDSGNDLPSGIYFYRIKFNSQRKDLTGYISLIR